MSVTAAGAAPYVELVPRFTRLASRVTIRAVNHPTRAHLDFAASDRNPVLADPAPKRVGKRRKILTRKELSFKGGVDNLQYSINETPLTDDEIRQPLAWKLMVRALWGVVKDGTLESCGNRIASSKWSEDAAYQPYQEVVAAYLHNTDSGWEFWVKIECAEWSSLFRKVSDEDGDGIRECYGKLNCTMPADSLKKTVAWIRDEYCGRVLSRQEAHDWVVDLASYWYPTRNTDLLELDPEGVWPDKSVGRRIRKDIRNIKIENPLAIIEAKPFSPDKPIYNVFIVPETDSIEDSSAKSEKTPAIQMVVDTGRSSMYHENSTRWYSEVKTYGPYSKWVIENGAFYRSVMKRVATFPQEQKAIPGDDGWIYFRKSFDALTGGDLTLQHDSLNPVVHITAFNNYLKSCGVSMLFVVVPDKVELYHRCFDSTHNVPAIPYVKPYNRKFLRVLQQQGVEVIDLLPCFLDAVARDSVSGEPLYQKQDTHWTSRGLQLAAEKITERIRSYGWREHLKDTIEYRFVDTVLSRQGDLVDRLPPEEQKNYQPAAVAARKVILPDGTPFRSNNPEAPIVLIGDSFTGVFELIDCKSAGVGAHIAARTKVPVDIITSWGGGPGVRRKMLRARNSVMDRKRVVVYMMVARDLYKYSQGWEPLKIPAR